MRSVENLYIEWGRSLNNFKGVHDESNLSEIHTHFFEIQLGFGTLNLYGLVHESI